MVEYATMGETVWLDREGLHVSLLMSNSGGTHPDTRAVDSCRCWCQVEGWQGVRYLGTTVPSNWNAENSTR